MGSGRARRRHPRGTQANEGDRRCLISKTATDDFVTSCYGSCLRRSTPALLFKKTADTLSRSTRSLRWPC